MPFCALPHRTVIGLAGVDAQKFLQGLISNDMAAVTTDKAIYAALLTPQGKFLHDMFVVQYGAGYLLDVETVRADQLIALLNRYKLRAQVTVENLTGRFVVCAAWHDQPQTVGIRFQDPRLLVLGWRCFVEKNSAPENIALFDYDQLRLSLGVADGSRDLDIEKDVLLEANFDLLNGISWDKGCYMGQELTARTHFRGLVKKRLFPIRIEGAVPPRGSIIRLDGQDVGDLRGTSGQLGLAMLRIESVTKAIANALTLTINMAYLSVSYPEWHKTEN
jgi:tRNA-modifying protein YgfZ